MMIAVFFQLILITVVEEIEKDIIKNEKLLHAITAPRKITANGDYLIDWYDKVY